MGILTALHHLTVYRYDRAVRMGPQIIRLRPAAHSRTRVPSYSLKVSPEPNFLNWIQDPYGNFLARVVFPDLVRELRVEVDLVADLSVYNPFDFFLEPEAETWPFVLSPALAHDLAPYLAPGDRGPRYEDYLSQFDHSAGRRTIDVLVALNQKVAADVAYTLRMEANVQSPDETLRLGSGSCRDSAVLLVEVLRSFGFAARFVSGYLLQLVPDKKPLTGPAGPEKDFTDLHAWAEAYVPGAGWIGLDATSGLLAGEGHIPLAATPRPGGASPVEGALEPCQVEFHHDMSLTRLETGPRPLKPWAGGDAASGRAALDAVGQAVDARLEALGYVLTMGAEPTFVSETDRTGAEWSSDAIGPTKKAKAWELLRGLKERWAPGALVHTAQGKWYPGESLPRWALSCFWRLDGQPLWKDPSLLADEAVDYGFTDADARKFLETLCDVLGVDPQYIIPAYEDPFHFLQVERGLPINLEPGDSKLADAEERARLVRVFDRGLDKPSGFVIPLQKGSWKSGPWPLRGNRLVLIPGDSPIGLRLPLDSLPWVPPEERDAWFPVDPQQAVFGAFPQPSRRAKEEPPQRLNPQALPALDPPAVEGNPSAFIVRTALCIQQRGGALYLFFPPMRTAEDWFALVAEVEVAAGRLGFPVILEGYQPAFDPRLGQLQITPDPGVIEVNLPPAASWDAWSRQLEDLYAEADSAGLSAEKYLLGGQVVGSGGGCHWILGGPTPAESPFLKRPDLLRSWVAFVNHHPSLSYLFAGLFLGATSQAPRLDEALPQSLHDLELAFAEADRLGGEVSPWLADRLFRHLLTDGTGNTHRTEICIDKLFSPDSAGGRRGLVEFRSFEMAPHVDLALSQSLLLRALTLTFLEAPFREAPRRWGTALRDRWLLPEFLKADLEEVLDRLDKTGLPLPRQPLRAHQEFRFPVLGNFVWDGMEFELRQALEPWPVLGEEAGAGGTVRYVDSSVERIQVKVSHWNPARYALACRGRQVPLQPADPVGTAVAGIRFKAWTLPSGLHPTLKADGTLVLDLVDLWNHRVVAGCTFHVDHPAGRNYDDPPVNAFEAESRRSARFEAGGYTPGPLARLPILVVDPEFPHTLDVRGVPAR
jgi:uncharacterized protein (DUF2126 family)/transglutaminase-like putative cysteine protease